MAAIHRLIFIMCPASDFRHAASGFVGDALETGSWKREAGLRLLVITTTFITVFSVHAFAQSDGSLVGTIARARTFPVPVREYVAEELSARDDLVLPPNLLTVPQHQALLERMLRSSAMFQRQCVRIANAPWLTVTIEFVAAHSTQGARARTQIVRRDRGLSAAIYVALLDDYVELVAHEIEHVIEQLDGIDLPVKAGVAESGVWQVGKDNAFETTRAIQVGRRVAREFRARQ